MDKLHLGEHISQQFNEELEDVRSRVLQMGGLVEDQLARALKAVLTGDTELAAEVVEGDVSINLMEVEIDEECTRIVARRQPAASDLRLMMAVIKSIADLERIGDEAKRIARMVPEELDGMMTEDVRQELEHMGELVREMLRLILDAFARIDEKTAYKVVKLDHKVDTKYVSITRHLMTYMSQDPTSIPTVLNLLWAARSLERMGDRCENIAEYIFYLIHGRDIRHIKTEKIMKKAVKKAVKAEKKEAKKASD